MCLFIWTVFSYERCGPEASSAQCDMLSISYIAGTKIILFLVCRRVRTPSVDAMTRDHKNDVLSNILAIVFGYLGNSFNSIALIIFVKIPSKVLFRNTTSPF